MGEAFRLALQFLTRLPIPGVSTLRPEALGRSVLMFPLVGLVIGLLLVLAHGLLDGAPPLLEAGLVLTLWVLLTGALHLDGLADSADAFVGGHGDRERILRIMKDPAAGPVGVTVIGLVLLLKFAALGAGIEWQALILAPVLGRAAIPALFLTTPYVRPGGLGAGMAETLPRRAAAGVLLLVGLITIVLLGAKGLGLLLLLVVAGFFGRLLLARRIGGTTGDTAGAGVEIIEVLTLVYLAL